MPVLLWNLDALAPGGADGVHGMDSPAGPLTLEARDGALVRLSFSPAPRVSGPVPPLLLRAEEELREYFAGARRAFDLPLRLTGTAFQTAAWQALLAIPWGETRTYARQAVMAGFPGAARAVGGANKRNPLPILVPCHRVVAADGLGGYAVGAEIKRILLAVEGAGGAGQFKGLSPKD